MLFTWGRILRDPTLWENTGQVAKTSGLGVKNLGSIPSSTPEVRVTLGKAL